MSPNGEIIIVTFPFSGHIFPATELATLLASQNYQITLLLPSVPSSPLHPLIHVVQGSSPPSGPPPTGLGPRGHGPSQGPPNGSNTEQILVQLIDERDSSSPHLLCVIVDMMIADVTRVCTERGVPAACLFTASACVAALEHASSGVQPAALGPDWTLVVPGLPEEMALTAFNLSSGQGGPPMQPPASGGRNALPPQASQGPPPHGHIGGPIAPSPLDHGHIGGPMPPPPPLNHGHIGGPMPLDHGHIGGPMLPPPLPDEGHISGFMAPPPGQGYIRGPMAPPPPFMGHHAVPPPFGHPGFIPSMPPFSQPMNFHGGGPPGPGGAGGPLPPPAMGLGQTDKAIALLFNTCDNLEHQFLEYIRKEAKKPTLAVGPLLPSQFWSVITNSTSLVHDESIRSKHDSSHKEQEVQSWLDSKPAGSVIYISFGSANTPCDAELTELAAGLEKSDQPFIWVIQKSVMKHDPAGLPIHEDGASSLDPNEVASRVGDRGLIIHGWAPQLMILTHKSTGGFLTHCGWNSTVEALGCGVPMLTWPIHGDQIYNAKLVTKQLRVGHVLKIEGQEAVKREQVVKGIDKLTKDEETRERVKAFSKEVFGEGFPKSSSNAIDVFLDLIDAKRTDTQ